jgi:hypothetical protein
MCLRGNPKLIMSCVVSFNHVYQIAPPTLRPDFPSILNNASSPVSRDRNGRCPAYRLCCPSRDIRYTYLILVHL